MTVPPARTKVSGRSGMACIAAIIGAALLISCDPAAEPAAGDRSDRNEVTAPSISHGLAEMTDPFVYECDVPGWRVTAQGRITASDGTEWTVPAEVAFKTGAKATDLYNDCTGVMLGSAGEIDMDTVPVVSIDDTGEVITAYIFGDNYAEIYVNGALVAVDAVPYWPFNTGVVRFRVKRPFTVAFKLVDWEENLGIGSEVMRGVPFHLGDGGLAAVFKDAAGATIAVTDGSWRAQTYYVAPLIDPECLSVVGETRLSDACALPGVENGADVYAAHWSLPKDWAAADFDDGGWQMASLYSNETIGGSLKRPAFANFADIFDDPEADAQFIWSSNLLLDNLVLVRATID